MYDNVCKYIAEMFSEDFFNWLIGKSIPLIELKPILAEGELKGEKRGERKALERVALNLLFSGMTVEQVAQVTELSIEEVQTLQIKGNISKSD